MHMYSLRSSKSYTASTVPPFLDDAVYGTPTSSTETMEGDVVTMHRFENRVFVSKISTPDESLECAAILLSLLLGRAIQDLKSDSLALRADAYFWLTSKTSDLYQHIAPRFGIDLSPSYFRDEILAAGLPDFPDHGTPYLTIDTDDVSSWSYSPLDESQDEYRSRLARLLTEDDEIAAEIEYAALNGVQLRFLGQKARACESATRTLLACIALNRHRKTTRLAIEGKLNETGCSAMF